MIAIDDVLISEDIVEKHFKCNLMACQGACCWEGDYGAPLEEDEVRQIEEALPVLLPYLSEEAKSIVQTKGVSALYQDGRSIGTPLVADKSCVYLVKNDLGYAYCSIERAYSKGEISVNKPISCHLYPIRVTKNKLQKFEAWNYDQWDICSPACKMGKKEKMKIYEFLKEAIIRYKGQSFYEQLEEAANMD